MLGITQEFPLEATWDDGTSFWMCLQVTDWGRYVTVMCRNNETEYAPMTDVVKDGEFSKVFCNMVDAAIECAADDTGHRWESQKLTVVRRQA